MEPETSIESGCMIRVAVVPVGEMPASNLREYIAMVMQHSRIELSSISSFYTEHQKSPFTQQPWESGSLKFKFMIGGAVRNPWEDFQAHRKIHGIIGLCHCPMSHDLAAEYDQFMSICKEYPSAQCKRCFAFHPSDIQVEQDDNKKRQHLILFPPADKQMLEFHMQTLMQDFAASLLMEFESRVLLAEPVGATLTTPLDSHAFLNSEEVSKAKKRRLERVQKTMGDYCLLAGSPVDANAHYSTAMELARHTGDVFWHAGALEGSVCAFVVDQRSQSDQMLEDEVKFRYYEVIQLYKRAAACLFEVEATLKLARFLCRKEVAKEVIDLLTNAVEGAKGLADVTDKVVLYVEVARIFGSIGYERKSAFFSREVAQLYQQQESRWAATTALQILLLTSRAYNVEGKGSSIKMQLPECTRDGQWSTLQIDVLSDMLAAATRACDPLTAWSAAARLLRFHYPLITPYSQISLASALAASSARLPIGTRCPDPGLPFIRFLSFPRLPLRTEIIRKFHGKKDWWVEPAASGPFIYTPLSVKNNDGNASQNVDVTWVVGEPVEVLVEVANPCAFDLTVESISLSVDAVDFEAFPVSITLPASTSQTLSLSGMPLSAGSLNIRGCYVNLNGVITEHLFEDVLDLISGAGRGLVLRDPFRSTHSRKLFPPISAIAVVPPMPLLVAEIVGGDGAIVFYEGEIREIQLKISNTGAVPVVEANLSLTGKQKEHVVSIGYTFLAKALPLNPGSSVLVPVKLRAGQPNSDVDGGTRGTIVRPSKVGSCPILLVHYAGPDGQDGKPEFCPKHVFGRQLEIPLQIHVLKGLQLVQARLLAMEVPAQINRTNSNLRFSTASNQPGNVGKLDLYRGSWSLRLLQLELWNPTDVLFEISVVRKRKGHKEDPTIGTDADDECLYPSTRLDREYSSRVLIPVEKFKLPFFDNSSARQQNQAGQAEEKSHTGERLTKQEISKMIAHISSKICVKWWSGRNSVGELSIEDGIREALQASVLESLVPDPLTFGFRLALTTSNSKPCMDTTGGGCLLTRELTNIEMLIKNNKTQAMTMTFSVACLDVTGSNCLDSKASETTVLWAGSLKGNNVEIPPLGEQVHTFALCFLVPGEYTLLGAAVIKKPDGLLETHTGQPFAIHVAGTS